MKGESRGKVSNGKVTSGVSRETLKNFYQKKWVGSWSGVTMKARGKGFEKDT